jgi:hypothetical protein
MKSPNKTSSVQNNNAVSPSCVLLEKENEKCLMRKGRKSNSSMTLYNSSKQEE